MQAILIHTFANAKSSHPHPHVSTSGDLAQRRRWHRAILTNTSSILQEYSKGQVAHLRYLRVKISKDNVTSISLFESIGFVRTSAEANYFGEVELRLQVQEREDAVLTDLENVKGWNGKPFVVDYREA